VHVRLPAVPPRAPVEVALPDVAARTLRIEVPIVDDRHPSYNATLEDTAGARVFEAAGLTTSGPGDSVVVTVPERLLVADNYTLRVTGEKLRGAPDNARVSLKYALHIRRMP
jgi:hypothetical protein